MWGLDLILFMTLGAQNQAAQATQSDAEKLASQLMQKAEDNARARAQSDSVDCYAIRSYIFKRQDGNAPVLIRTTTCTPANAVRPEQVAHPPKARLVPQ